MNQFSQPKHATGVRIQVLDFSRECPTQYTIHSHAVALWLVFTDGRHQQLHQTLFNSDTLSTESHHPSWVDDCLGHRHKYRLLDPPIALDLAIPRERNSPILNPLVYARPTASRRFLFHLHVTFLSQRDVCKFYCFFFRCRIQSNSLTGLHLSYDRYHSLACRIRGSRYVEPHTFPSSSIITCPLPLTEGLMYEA